MLNSIEPPWYVTRMPGGVTGTARKGLPMSIINRNSKLTLLLSASRMSPSRLGAEVAMLPY